MRDIEIEIVKWKTIETKFDPNGNVVKFAKVEADIDDYKMQLSFNSEYDPAIVQGAIRNPISTSIITLVKPKDRTRITEYQKDIIAEKKSKSAKNAEKNHYEIYNQFKDLTGYQAVFN